MKFQVATFRDADQLRKQRAARRRAQQVGDTTVTEMTAATTKTCPKCKVTQDTTGFGKDKHRKDGLMNWCKGCMTAYWAVKRGTAYLGEDGQVHPVAGAEKVKPEPIVDEAKLDDPAFVATDEGQAALQAAADAAQAARRATRNDEQRRRRAAAKAAALGEQVI